MEPKDAEALVERSSAVAQLKFHRHLSVCVFVFLHDVSKTTAARITKLDVEIFHRESWKPINFGVIRTRSIGTKNNASMSFCILVIACFS